MSIARRILEHALAEGTASITIDREAALDVLADYNDKQKALTAALQACDGLRATNAWAGEMMDTMQAERDAARAELAEVRADAAALVNFFEECIEVTTSPGTLQTLRANLDIARSLATRSA